MNSEIKKIKEFLKNRGVKFHSFQEAIIVGKKIFSFKDINTNLEKIIIEKNWIHQISRELNIPIQKYIEKYNKEYKKEDFFCFKEKEILKDWESLKNTKKINVGFKSIRHFHKSILDSKKENKESPIEAINNKDKLNKVILNRLIYSKKISNDILINGLNISRMGGMVSIFSPQKTKELLNEFATKDQYIIDPFSGFSGRLLGTLALNKIYTGSDIRQETINESNNILDFLNLKANLSCSDFKDFKYEGDVLLTCPPYSKKEQWPGVNDYYPEDYYIDWILSNSNCKKHIFIVKETKYSNFIKKEIKNGSWNKTKNNEKVLVFT